MFTRSREPRTQPEPELLSPQALTAALNLLALSVQYHYWKTEVSRERRTRLAGRLSRRKSKTLGLESDVVKLRTLWDKVRERPGRPPAVLAPQAAVRKAAEKGANASPPPKATGGDKKPATAHSTLDDTWQSSQRCAADVKGT